MPRLRPIRTLIAVVFTAIVVLINAQLYQGPFVAGADVVDEDVIAQLEHLRQALDEGAGQNMQSLYPEGFYFTHVLYGLAWSETARRADDPELRRRGIGEARWALEMLDSPEGTAPFSRSLDPPWGIFHAGWKAWLWGTVLAVEGGTTGGSGALAEYRQLCDAIATAFDRSTIPFLESYPGAAWPADATIAVAALRLHDHLYEPAYAATIERWLVQVKKNLDRQTGLMPHAVDPVAGEIRQGARGSSQSLMLRFLLEIDPEWARALYPRYRELFVGRFLAMPAIREYPEGHDGDGDVDSGPVVLGIGASATVVGIGTARMFGDHDLARPIAQSVETLGLPWEWGGQKCYLFGAVPTGDAFLAWSKIAQPYTTHVAEPSLPSVASWWWRMPFHLISLLLLLLVWLPARRRDEG